VSRARPLGWLISRVGAAWAISFCVPACLSIVPTHNHDDRPTLVYIVKGEIIEHNTYCLVPIVWKAGEESKEFGPGFGHWWENKGDTEVVLTSSDVVAQETVDLDKPDHDM
jgi:quercetin dioxygenase-like cupin family protein